MKKRSMLVFLLALIMIVSTACGNETVDKKTPDNSQEKTEVPENPSEELVKADGGIFIYALTTDPKVMNPLYAVDGDTITVTNTIYSPLFVQDAEAGETRHYLAESVTPSEDYLTYTLKLKEGLKWHDGEAINADDLVFTINSILDPNQKTHLIGSFLINGEPVEINKVDDLTVEFKLPQVSASFMTSLERLRPIPEHVFEGEADLATSTKNFEPIGSGPFKFKEFNSGEKVELERFEDYFDGRPNLDGIVYRVIPDTNSANTALLNGELSARSISADDLDKYSGNDDFNIEVFFRGRLNNMVYKLNNEALQNKDVRQAIAYAINKDEIITGVYQSDEFASKAYSVFSPTTQYYTDDLERYEHNVEKAKELLKKAGYENLKLRLAFTNSSKQLEATGLIMQQQLKEVGIELELIPMERGTFVTQFVDASSTNFDLAFNGYAVGFEPSGYSPLFLSGEPNNFMGYVNHELDDLWSQGIVETDPEKRSEIYETIQKTLIDDMVLYPIEHPKAILVIDSKFGGIEETRLAPVMFEDLSKLYMYE